MSTVPAFLHGLVADASPLPPAEAVASHLQHRAAPYGDLVGPLVVGDAQLTGLTGLTGVDAPLGVTVVVSGGAGALEPAAVWAGRAEHVVLRGLQIALRDSATGEIAHNARRITTAVDQLVADGRLDDDVAVHVEPPRLTGEPTRDWLAALDEVAAVDQRLALRTGEVDALELATCVGAALDRELRFTCTGDLVDAVRRDGRHGSLNVLVATRASLDGAAVADVAAVLEETDSRVLLTHADAIGLAGAHRWFTSAASSDVAGSVADLRATGLVA